MKIIFDGIDMKVINAVRMGNRMFLNSKFYAEIKQKSSFNMSNTASIVIADLIEKSALEFSVKVYKPSWWERQFKYKKTLAFTDKKYPNTLFLLSNRLNREEESIAASIIHECIHALDASEKDYEFGHGDNSSAGKENTAPYWIGNLAYRLLKGDVNAPLQAFDQIRNFDGAGN